MLNSAFGMWETQRSNQVLVTGEFLVSIGNNCPKGLALGGWPKLSVE